MAIVKANAYGHGAAQIARAAIGGGVTHFGVACVDEADELRRAGVRGDIYLLSPFLPDEADAIVRADLVPMVSSPEQLAALARATVSAPLPARCFLMLDTGMGREGALTSDALTLWNQAQTLPLVRVTGIATHLASADEADDEGDGATHAQFDGFEAFLQAVGPDALAQYDDGRGNRGVWLSVVNSPGMARFGSRLSRLTPLGIRGSLLRPGLLLYGIEPHRRAFMDLPQLQPALAWRARVTLLRELPTGATVGYGRTHTITRPSRIATLAAGYADGVARRLGNRGHVLLNGRRFPLVGRISMDQCQIDVTDARTPVALGEAATFIGDDNGESQTVLDLADLLETTPHEVTCALSRRVSRVYVNG